MPTKLTRRDVEQAASGEYSILDDQTLACALQAALRVVDTLSDRLERENAMETTPYEKGSVGHNFIKGQAEMYARETAGRLADFRRDFPGLGKDDHA
jgi:hypothetical protein